MPDILHIAIDSREQAPWHFPPDKAVVSRRTLPTGDYALVLGDETDIGFAVERKSLDDFVGTISTGAERFAREIERMDGWPCRVVVVEGQDTDIVQHRYNHPAVSPAFVTAEIVRLAWRGVHVYLAADAARAAQVAWRFLLERYLQLTDPFYGLEEGAHRGGNSGSR